MLIIVLVLRVLFNFSYSFNFPENIVLVIFLVLMLHHQSIIPTEANATVFQLSFPADYRFISV